MVPRRSLSLFIAACVIGLLCVSVAQAAGPYQFKQVTPCRVVDTRSGKGGITGPILSGDVHNPNQYSFPIRNAQSCGVPTGATAVALNMTVTNIASPGWVALFPADQPWPGVSNINFVSGDFVANGAVVPMATSGTKDVSVFANFAGTQGCQVILDVTGYFIGSGGLNFYAVTPCRVIDTQSGLGGFTGFLPNGFPATQFSVKGNCGIPSDAVAVSVNAIAANTQNQGWFALYPGSGSWPGVSNVNFFAGDTIGNGALVPVSAGANDLNVLAAFAAGPTGAYLELDVTGYFK
jgi:hypothetical protein